MPSSSRFSGVAACLLLGLTPAMTGAEEPVTVAPAEKWSDVFCDSQATFHYLVRAERAFDGRLGWSLSVNERALARGEQAFGALPDKPAQAAIRLEMPHVKEGVVVEARLSVAIYSLQGKQTADHSRPIWIFSRDPFVDRTEWLKAMGIRLFDPLGKTAEVFQKASIPFTLAGNVAALEADKGGLLVIGEGVSLRDYRALPEAMLAMAARGRAVLCLAPADGMMPLPGTKDASTTVPSRLVLRRHDIITELDKRLDALAWPPEGKIIASRLAVTTQGGRVVAAVSADEGGWPWLQAVYPARQGTLLVCGFGMIRHWEDSPAPRFLLARIFALLDGEQDKQDKMAIRGQTDEKE